MNIRAKVDSSNNLKNSTNSLQLESIKDSDEYDNISPENSKNSQHVPTVIEKQNATIETYIGLKLSFLLFLFNKSTNEKPIPAHKNPFRVCNIVSQYGIFI